jgi:hypothetical protein
MYAIATEHGEALHYVRGNMEDVRDWNPKETLCGRTVKPLNYFRDLADYVNGYNCRGYACKQCAKVSDQ